MITRIERGRCSMCFVLTPNRSASWRQLKLFFAGIACVSLTIATGFALVGFWPVLPFAGAELLLLGACLWLTADRARVTEVVDIEPDTVAVKRGRGEPQQRWAFQRAWAQVRLVPSSARLHPSRLLIGSHGKLVHLGAFLTERERRGLARDLRLALQPAPRV